MKYCSLILRSWQTIFLNFLSIKPNSITQMLTNIIALILFQNIYYIIKELLQKKSFGKKNKKIIRFFFFF